MHKITVTYKKSQSLYMYAMTSGEDMCHITFIYNNFFSVVLSFGVGYAEQDQNKDQPIIPFFLTCKLLRIRFCKIFFSIHFCFFYSSRIHYFQVGALRIITLSSHSVPPSSIQNCRC